MAVFWIDGRRISCPGVLLGSWGVFEVFNPYGPEEAGCVCWDS